MPTAMSDPIDENPFGAPPAAPSPADSMADPLNGGPTNWGSAQAMEDNAYLYDKAEVKVGPMALLEGAMGVIKNQPGVLILVGLLSGGAWYGVEKTVGAGLVDLTVGIVGPKAAAGVSQFVVMLIIWCIGLLLQGPLLGAALQAKTNRKKLVGVYGRRAMERFSSLAAIAGMNLVVSIGAMIGWFGAVWVLTFIASAIGGILGGLILVIGAIAGYFGALAVILRFAIAAPAAMAERLGAVEAMKRSAELTRGTPLAMAFALIIPIVSFIAATFFLNMFGILAAPTIALVWVVGFYIFYMMLALAFVPSAYVTYRFVVEETRPEKIIDG